LACLLASTCYAVAASYTRRYLTGVPALASATGSLLGGPGAGAAHPVVLAGHHAGSARLGRSGCIAVLCTGIAYIMYFRLIARVGSSRALAVTFLAPVFAVLYGMLFLGEHVTPWMLGCGLVIVCGTLLSTGLMTWRGGAR